jgi:transcriptional regulator with XRE-family HTH domain
VQHVIETLAKARRAQRISQTELGNRLGGLSHIAVADWEHGRDAPTCAHLLTWASALGFAVVLTAQSADPIPIVTPPRCGQFDQAAACRSLGKALRTARTRAELTQEHAAKVINVSEWTIGQWEAGRRTPLFRSLTKYLEMLRCRLELLPIETTQEPAATAPKM